MENELLKQMPSHEVLQQFLAGMLGAEVTVTFNPEEGVFENHEANQVNQE